MVLNTDPKTMSIFWAHSPILSDNIFFVVVVWQQALSCATILNNFYYGFWEEKGEGTWTLMQATLPKFHNGWWLIKVVWEDIARTFAWVEHAMCPKAQIVYTLWNMKTSRPNRVDIIVVPKFQNNQLSIVVSWASGEARTQAINLNAWLQWLKQDMPKVR